MKSDELLLKVLSKKTARESNVMGFFGILKDNKVFENMEKEILEQRKKSGIEMFFLIRLQQI